MKTGAASISIVTAIGALFTWCAGLSVALYNDHATIAAIASNIATKQDIIEMVSEIKSERRMTLLTSFASSTYEQNK